MGSARAFVSSERALKLLPVGGRGARRAQALEACHKRSRETRASPKVVSAGEERSPESRTTSKDPVTLLDAGDPFSSSDTQAGKRARRRPV